jgi:hypothetical protein
MLNIERKTVYVTERDIREHVDKLGVVYAADYIEHIALKHNLVPHSYRYHSYDPLKGVYIFIESADTMADKIMGAVAQKIKEIPGIEQVQLDSTTTVRRGIGEIIEAVQEMHNESREDNSNT